MSASDDLSFRAVNEKRRAQPGAPALSPLPPSVPPAGAGLPASEIAPAERPKNEPRASNLPFDPWRVAAAIWRHWIWIVLGGIVLGGAGLALGLARFEDSYSISTTLIRQEPPNAFQTSQIGETYKPKQLTMGTLVSVMRSPALLNKAAASVVPPMSPSLLGSKITITTERNADVIRVTYEGARSAQATASVLAAYGEAVLQLTRDLQAQEAEVINKVLRQQLGQVDTDLIASSQAMLAFSKETRLIDAEKETEAYLRLVGDLSIKYETARIESEGSDLRIKALEAELLRNSPLSIKLDEAREELNSRLVRYTDANPLVAEQRSKVQSIETQIAELAKKPQGSAGSTTSNVGMALYLDLVNLKGQKQTQAQQLQELLKVRDGIQAKLELMPEKGMQYARLLARRQALEGARAMLASRQREAQLYMDQAPGYYRLISTPAVQDVVAKKSFPKVVLLAIALGAMGTFGTLGLVALRELLDDRLKTPHDLGRTLKMPVILRIPHLEPLPAAGRQQWLFRTWTALSTRLEQSPGAPLLLGILSGAPDQGASTLVYLLATAAFQRGHHVIAIADRPAHPGEISPESVSEDFQAALENPRPVFQGIDPAGASLHAFNGEAAALWNPLRRRQWASALQAWRPVRSLVILVEVPVGGDPDILLLAESLPNLLWVGGPSEERLPEYPQLETMRGAGCRFLGAAFNERPHPTLRFALPEWMRRWTVVIAALACLSLGAQAAPPKKPAAAPTGATAAPATPVLPAWRDKLTLGPGDSLNLRLFGSDESILLAVPISPDGKISYLEAHDIQAAGKTIDEIRDALDAELGKFRRAPRTIVTPAGIHSKRYFIMGKVVDTGSYELDRPLTLVEGVARARGLEVGLSDHNTVELADLPRSFLVRRGQRMPVDFVKLFQKADLSQNVALEPDDYIFFAAGGTSEVYLLGAVRNPGVVGISSNMTVSSLITTRGGFAPKAYLDRIVVVRGSLDHPKKYLVDLKKMLKGKALDFVLEPKDIVFVADKPLADVEELANLALRTFVQAATTSWVSGNVAPIISAPILPQVQ